MSPLVLRRELDSTHQACESFCLELRQRLAGEIGSRDLFRAELTVREGLANALEHGNGFSQDKQIFVALELSQRCLRVTITDQGQGFTPPDDPVNPETLEDHGKGLSILRLYTNLLEHDDGGRTLRFELPVEIKE